MLRKPPQPRNYSVGAYLARKAKLVIERPVARAASAILTIVEA